MTLLIQARNVNDAFFQATKHFIQAEYTAEIRKTSPRGMDTSEWNGPAITEYLEPRERVLFNPYRDANPYLHFFGALWMLAGRHDVKFLAEFSKRMPMFSDNGVTLRGAYGFRWVNYFETDQINEVLRLFTNDPETRRAVLAMWDPTQDLAPGKDIPCNTHVYFKLRGAKLDMTVCCRSNDLIWGCYGADVVDFSMLQEYMADKLRAALDAPVRVGTYRHLSDSLHVYHTPHPSGKVWNRVYENYPKMKGVMCPYTIGRSHPYALGADDQNWDHDLQLFFSAYDKMGSELGLPSIAYETDFFKDVVMPMWASFIQKEHDYKMGYALNVLASDWSLATADWLIRHHKEK
jgi:thymidylate synthase